MDLPIVVVDDERVDVALASRLVVTALDQMLFFKGQIPMPMARLPLLPAQHGDRLAKKRKEFLNGHRNLVQDIIGLLRAASYAFSSHDYRTFPSIQAVFVLGTLSVPRARFTLSLEGMEATIQNSSVVCTDPDSPEADEQHENEDDDEEPPKSESESENSGDENPRAKAISFATPQPMRSSFRPFSDESSPSSSPLPASSAPKDPATSRIALFGTPPERTPLALRHLDENARFKSNIEKRHRATEREVCLKIASMDGIIEDIDTSKLQVYLCAPRTVEHDRWLPRVALRTKLDNVMQEGLGQNISPRGKRFHNSNSNNNSNVERKRLRIDGLRITSAAANRSPASRSPALQPKHVEAQEVIEVDEEEGENIWFQWDGKLSGIPVEL